MTRRGPRPPRPAAQRRERARELGLALRQQAPPPAASTAAWLRAVRRLRGMSQRDLADAAGVPCSTVARIEARVTVPRLDTMLRLLAAAGLDLAVIDRRGRPLRLDERHDRLRDGRGRRFPAHLVSGPTPPYSVWNDAGRDWWAWERIAWLGDRWTPENTYWRDRPFPREIEKRIEPGTWDALERNRVWDDAT